MLLNEFGEICCLDGEECIINNIIPTTENIFDLVNNNGEKSVHFLLSEKDLEDKVYKTILSVVEFIRNNDISIN